MSERRHAARVEWYPRSAAQRTRKRFKLFHTPGARRSDPTFSHEFPILRRQIGPRGAVYLSFAEDEPRAAVYAKIRVSPIEVALVYRKLLEQAPGRTQADVGRMVGRTDARVNQLLSLLKLDPEILAYLSTHRDPSTVAYFTERRLRGLLRIRSRAASFVNFERMKAKALLLEDKCLRRPRRTR